MKAADLYFIVMSPNPYFHFISGLYLSNHLKYFNDSLLYCITGQCKVSHARMKILLFFLIISPDPYFLIAVAFGNLIFFEFPSFLLTLS